MLVSGALKRMNGEDVFGRRIGTRNVPAVYTTPAYSSDEGYSTAPAPPVIPPAMIPPAVETARAVETIRHRDRSAALSREWALALQRLPTATAASKPRQIRGTHGSNNIDLSGSSFNSADDSRRAGSPWNSSTVSEQSSDTDHAEPAEITVTNLPNYNANALKEMILQLFSQYVPILTVSIWGTGEGSIATVSLKSEWDARLLIARIHKRRLEQAWSGRRLELSLGRPSPALNLDVLRARLRAILLDQPNFSMPLLRLRDAYASRHCCALTTADIAKVRDTVVIQENFGRIVQLVDISPSMNVDLEDTAWRCNIHGMMNMGQDDGSRILTPVFMELEMLSKHTQILLENHGGMLPLLSFVECYEATFAPLVVDESRGVALELLLRGIPELIVRDHPLRHLAWATPSNEDANKPVKPRTAPCLEPVLSLFERELMDLLKVAPKSTIQFSKLIPAYHHHYARQCRVAEYGFTKLPDLLAALTNTIVVLGSGSSRVVSLSASAQARRWTSDLNKLLRAHLRPVFPYEIPQLFRAAFAKPFLPADYGLCTLHELLNRVPPSALIISPDGGFSLPRREPSAHERARTARFAADAAEILCATPNLRLDFARFVPAYHSHFGRQLRVGHYGCVKLLDLFDLVSDTIAIRVSGGDKIVHLAPQPARAVVAQRISAISPVNLNVFSVAYATKFGAPPLPDMLDVLSIEELIIAAGGYIDNFTVRGPSDGPKWVNAALMACAVLSSDKSVAKGSTLEYFISCFKERFGSPPNVCQLESSGVISQAEGRVVMSTVWRLVWRVGLILSQSTTPMHEAEIYTAYVKRYEPVMPVVEVGFKSAGALLRYFAEVFAEEGSRWRPRAGVTLPHAAPDTHTTSYDYSLFDTPPGHKGSRVFESPSSNAWRSPPASALPAPHSLISAEPRRRTRLAVQFNAI